MKLTQFSVRSLGRSAVLALLLGVWGNLAVLAQDLPEVVAELIEKAEARRSQGQLAEAIATYRQALELGPQVPQIYGALGGLYHQQGQSEAALEMFTRGIEVAPRDRNLRYNGTVVAMSLGRLEPAKAWVEQALVDHPKDFELHLIGAAVFDRLDQKTRALELLLDAESLKPGDAQVWFRLGNLYHAIGQSNEAVESYRRALRKDPEMMRAHYNLGAVLFALGRNDEALEAYRIALAPIQKAFAAGEKVDAVHTVAFANLGTIFTQAKKWPEALDAFDKALRLDPQRVDLWSSRAFVAYQLGRLDAALADFEKVLASDPKAAAALLHVGLIQAKKGQCAAAVARFEQGMPSFDTAARLAALEPLARCYAALGRQTEAESTFRTVLKDRPRDPDLLFALGRILRQAPGRDAEAQELFSRADEARPGHRATQLELLALAEKRGDVAAQITLAEALLKAHGAEPTLWKARYGLGLLYLENGRPREAIPHLETLASNKAVPATAKAEIARSWGLALAAAGQYEEARKRLKDDPAGSRNALAFVEAMAGRPDAALQAMGGGANGPAERANLGLILWSLGRFDEAKPHLEAGGSAPALRVALGDLALRRGDTGAALDAWQEVANGCGATPPKMVKLCAWVQAALGQARLQAAFGELARVVRSDGPPPSGLRATADTAVAQLTAQDPRRAQVLYLRGTLRLLGQDLDGASADLQAALESKPNSELEGVLRHQLAVAQARQGRLAEARRLFEASRALGGVAGATAALNLAILLDQEGKRAEALPLYQQYLQSDGPRRGEIENWVARLREVVP